VAYEADLPAALRVPSQHAEDLVDIYFGREYMGYSWVFPKRDHWNVGVGALASQSPNVKTATIDFIEQLEELPRKQPHSTQNGKGWVIPAGGYRRPLGRGRILLVGDAAGFVDPFYGEGIAYAILSGVIAGSVLGNAAALRSPTGDAPRVVGT
jgi:flavin-dependent dehydrogenase